MALKKSVYKPAAFFKGILLPLCKEGCTLREAVIVASVLQRVSIPVHHSAVAIHKLAQMKEYNGAASIFIKTLLNKKYSLPAPVITSLINHFVLGLLKMNKQSYHYQCGGIRHYWPLWSDISIRDRGLVAHIFIIMTISTSSGTSITTASWNGRWRTRPTKQSS